MITSHNMARYEILNTTVRNVMLVKSRTNINIYNESIFNKILLELFKSDLTHESIISITNSASKFNDWIISRIEHPGLSSMNCLISCLASSGSMGLQ